jgi:O-antigen/teichoic acid export membrane protein
MAESEATGWRRLLTGVAANWTGFAAQLAAAFFVSPVLVHGLGDRRYGVWSLIESVLAYLMLLDLGVAASVVRYVARFDATREREALNRLFSTSLCIFAAAGAAIFAVTLVAAFPAFALLPVPADLATEGRWMLVLLGLNLAVGLPMNVFACVLDGLGRYPAKSAVRTAGVVIRSVLLVVVIRAGGGLLAVAGLLTAHTVLEHLALAVAARRYLPGLRFSLRLVNGETFRAVRGYSAHALLAMVAGRISFQTDALVIGAFLLPQHITYFALAGRLTEYAKDALRVATTVLTPAVSALEAKGDGAAIRDVFVNSTRYVLWLILPVQLGLLLFGRPFLALWMGPEYAVASYGVLAILAAPLGLAMAQSVSVRILYGLGLLRWYAWATLAEALANLLLSVALVRPWGIEGVALGTAIPSVLLNLAVGVYVCRQLGVGAGHYLRRSFLRPCALAVLLGVCWWAASSRVAPTSWPALMTLGAVGLVGYAVAAALAEFGGEVMLRQARALTATVSRAVTTALPSPRYSGERGRG